MSFSVGKKDEKKEKNSVNKNQKINKNVVMKIAEKINKGRKRQENKKKMWKGKKIKKRNRKN